MKVKKIGHVALRVADEARSRAFYRDVLGFRVSEEDPDHGGVFMTLGYNFHTIDVFGHPEPDDAPKPQANQIGLFHIAFEVEKYSDLKETYVSLLEHNVAISHCVDHISQRSIYFLDPDGNRLEVYFEIPNALERFATESRGDQDVSLTVTKPGEPLPAWLDEAWPPAELLQMPAPKTAAPA